MMADGFFFWHIRTLLNTVLLDFTLALLLLDALDAVIEVVLGGGALGGVLALYLSKMLVSNVSYWCTRAVARQ